MGFWVARSSRRQVNYRRGAKSRLGPIRLRCSEKQSVEYHIISWLARGIRVAPSQHSKQGRNGTDVPTAHRKHVSRWATVCRPCGTSEGRKTKRMARRIPRGATTRRTRTERRAQGRGATFKPQPSPGESPGPPKRGAPWATNRRASGLPTHIVGRPELQATEKPTKTNSRSLTPIRKRRGWVRDDSALAGVVRGGGAASSALRRPWRGLPYALMTFPPLTESVFCGGLQCVVPAGLQSEPTLETEGWTPTKVNSRSLTPIRERRAYHPNTRRPGVRWGPRTGFGIWGRGCRRRCIVRRGGLQGGHLWSK